MEPRSIKFIIPGPPVGKQAKQRDERGFDFVPKLSRDYYKWIRKHFDDQFPNFEQFDCALIVEYKVYFLIPKSWSKKKKEMAVSGQIVPTVKPDLDNISKIFDALNPERIKDSRTKQIVRIITRAWRDDAQIARLKLSKDYSFNPRVEVTITAWQYQSEMEKLWDISDTMQS